MKFATRTYLLGIHLFLSLTDLICAHSFLKILLYLILFSSTYLLKKFAKATSKSIQILIYLVFLSFAQESFSAQCFLALVFSYSFPKYRPICVGCLAAALSFHTVLYMDIYCFCQALTLVFSFSQQQKQQEIIRKNKDRQSLINKERTNSREENWKQLCDLLPYGIAIQVTLNKKWIYCNPALNELLDAPIADMAFAKMEKIHNRLMNESSKSLIIMQQFDKVGGGTFAEPENLNKDQENITASISFDDVESKKQYDISCKPIKWNEENALLYTMKDVTEKNKIEALRLGNVIKSRILRSLSHELRNPISAILNSLEFCKNQLITDETTLANINIAITNANILLAKYNDILDFVKIEMDTLTLECVDFDIRELIKEVGSLLELQVELRGLTYECKIAENVPREINSDPNRILQVVLNLLENAIKYNKKGGNIILSIKQVNSAYKMPSHKDVDIYEISVTDTGQGIDFEKLSKLFSLEEIGNEKNGSKRVSVSLPVAYNICKKLGGELRVSTQIGKGSTFSFQVVSERRKSTFAQSERMLQSEEEMNEIKAEEMSKKDENLELNSRENIRDEWDVEDDVIDLPAAHVPLRSARTKIMISTHSNSNSPPLKFSSNRVLSKAKSTRRFETRQKADHMVLQRELNRCGKLENEEIINKKIAFTDLTPDTIKGLGVGVSMLSDIIKKTATPKRSFSFDDLFKNRNSRSKYDVAKLKLRISKMNEFRRFLLQTVKRDSDTIRSNIIRSKGELFAPLSYAWKRSSLPLYKKSPLLHPATPARVKNIREGLLNFHKDNEQTKKELFSIPEDNKMPDRKIEIEEKNKQLQIISEKVRETVKNVEHKAKRRSSIF